MTILIDTIKKAKIQAFKDKDEVKNTLLGTVIGEAGTKAKNDGDRQTTDADIVSVMKRTIINIDETFKIFVERPVTKPEDMEKRQADEVKMKREKEILLELMPEMPKQLSEDELRAEIQKVMKELSLSGPKAMGVIMKELKTRFEGQYDGAMASKISKELLA